MAGRLGVGGPPLFGQIARSTGRNLALVYVVGGCRLAGKRL